VDWLKSIWFHFTFPIRFWIEKYNDYKREKKIKEKIKKLQKQDPFIYK